MSEDPRDARRRPRAVRIGPDPGHAFKEPLGFKEHVGFKEPLGSKEHVGFKEPPSSQAPHRAPDKRESEASIVEMTTDPFAFEALALEPQERAIETAQKNGIFRRSVFSWGGLFWSALGGLVSLGIGLWITRLVDDLFARAPALGAVGLGLAGLIILALLILGGRELLAISRQRHIARLHQDFASAHAGDDQTLARKLVADLASLYTARPETARGRKHVLGLRNEIVDGRDLVEIAERSLVAPLDAKAQAAIAAAAKRVSIVTTIAPRAIIDVVFVLVQAVRLIRQIADIYGGRPGFLGFIKLARSVGAHLAITGGMAAGDSLLQQVVGHGIAAKISARLGEGVLNGLLTARIGLSAMAVCRPMPFAAEPTPNLRKVVPFLFRSTTKTDSKPEAEF